MRKKEILRVEMYSLCDDEEKVLNMQSDAEKEYNLNAKNVEDKRDAAMNGHNDVERICF